MTNQKIKRIREIQGITQAQMAEWLHMDPSAYCRLESGLSKISIERLQKISEILGVPIERLLGSEPIQIHLGENGEHKGEVPTTTTQESHSHVLSEAFVQDLME